MSADGIVVAEPIGNSVADLSPKGRSTTEMPPFEAGEFAQLVDGGDREDVDPQDAQRLKAQMTALVGDDTDARGAAGRAVAKLLGR